MGICPRFKTQQSIKAVEGKQCLQNIMYSTFDSLCVVLCYNEEHEQVFVQQ